MQQDLGNAGVGRADPLADRDLTDPAIVSDPYPTYGWLQENAPVVWNQQLRGWVVTRYDDVERVLRDPRTSVEKLQPFVAHSSASERSDVELLGQVLGDWMVFRDPPRHNQLRRALKDAFMPGATKALAPQVRRILHELLASLPTDEPVDMVQQFAFPLPAMVIGELFGLRRDELDDLKAWSDPLGKFVLASTERDNLYRNAGRAVRAMKDRFHLLVEEHRRKPKQNFTSHLIANAGDLSDDEIVHTLVLVLWAGHDTTTNHLATTIHYLCARPDLFQSLRRDPSLIPGAVEEFLRLDGPAHMLVRLAKSEMTLGGKSIGAGERIFLMMNTANRDPRKFAHSDTPQPERKKNRHLAFGKGIHVCLGAPLARLEGVEALSALCAHYADIRFADTPSEWRQNLIMRGPRYLPVRLTPA